MLAAERGASANTQLSYANDLAAFAEFLGRSGRSLTEADATLVRDWLALLGRAGMAPSTGARKLSALRQFHRFLVAENIRADDPTAMVEGRARAARCPAAERGGGRRHAERRRAVDGARGKRLVALVELLYATGLRVSELAGLPLRRWRATAAPSPCAARAGSERMVPLSDAAREAIADWLPLRARFIRGRREDRRPGCSRRARATAS